jgi:hypothetical protein
MLLKAVCLPDFLTIFPEYSGEFDKNWRARDCMNFWESKAPFNTRSGRSMRPGRKSQNFQFITLARQFSFLDVFC